MKYCRAIFTACLVVCIVMPMTANAVRVYSDSEPPLIYPQKKDYHLCKDEDLVGGTWKLVLFRETPPHREATYYRSIPYHYIAFFPQRVYAFIATNKEIMSAASLQKTMQASLMLSQEASLRQRLGKYYSLSNGGVLGLYRGKKGLYSFRCIAVSNTQGDFVKGDLVLVGYTKKKRTQIYELYRRWY